MAPFGIREPYWDYMRRKLKEEQPSVMTINQRRKQHIENEIAKTLETKQDDKVEKPSHYTRYSIEPITFIMRNGIEFWRGNIIKYATRAGYKKYDDLSEVDSEITDLKKVIRYAEMRINQLNGETDL